ncbi:glycosyltransferase [Orrella sp. 11846]|uniref:glycosyltransferase n=1 Tax=Orrella sp. 11846 TaxID=3409913 RepID=UPI003B593121
MPPSKNRRILYVIGTLDVGGAELHLVRICKELKQRDWKPEIFTLALGGVLTKELEKHGITIHGVTARRSPTTALGRKMHHVFNMWHLIKIMRTRQYAVSHFFLPAAYLFGAIAAIISRTSPRIMSRRSMNHYQARRPVFGWVERKMHTYMDRICGNSQAVMVQLKEEGVPEKRLRLIYNGIEISAPPEQEHRQQVRSALGLKRETLVMVIVANLIPYKGHADLIDALGQIKHELPQDWVVLCVGRDSGILTELKHRAEIEDISQHIMWLGSRLDIPDILMASDIGLLVSHEEGFSNAILEAMSAELPMVVTDVGGNREAVIDGQTGYVVSAKNANALGQAILKLVANPQRHWMGQQGRRRVKEHFSLDVCVDHYETLYTELIS